jgi:hypothetical protein
VHNDPAALSWLPDYSGANRLVGCTALVVALTGAYLVVGLLAFVAWQITGQDAWVEEFFKVPAALLLVTLAAAQLALSLSVVREFSPGQPLRTAWQLIAMAAGCDLAGGLLVHILGADTPLNLLSHLGFWSSSLCEGLQQAGFVLGGSCRFLLLAAGLFWALGTYRQTGFLARLATIDWILLAGVGVYIVREAHDLMVALQHGKHPGLAEMLGWPTDPLLCLLLAEGMLLFRSVRQMGRSLVGRCWKALAVGVALVVLGDMTIWATNYSFLPWPWSALGWYIWLPAAGAFALGPGYQLEAIYQARTARGGNPLVSPS